MEFSFNLTTILVLLSSLIIVTVYNQFNLNPTIVQSAVPVPISIELDLPIIINTWPWTQATDAAYNELIINSGSAIDAVEAGCTECELLQCDGTVGFGGSPDESGETTLDALIMNGNDFSAGSVGNMRNIKPAISVARSVMDYTIHTLLSGSQATEFAIEMGFKYNNLTTVHSIQQHSDWLVNNCQPNFRRNVNPNSKLYCGPYKPNKPAATAAAAQSTTVLEQPIHSYNQQNHDTIGMIVMDNNYTVAVGTSTNGARNKIPGRIGDSPIIGSGGYADSTVGGCSSTGDGDIMMRFLPCYQAVESIRQGLSAQSAADDAIKRIANRFPTFQGAIVVLSALTGEIAAASYGWTFSYSYRTKSMNQTIVVQVPPITL